MEKGNEIVPFLIMLPLKIYFASHILKFEPHPHPDPPQQRSNKMIIQQESKPLPQPHPHAPLLFEPHPQRSNKRIIQQLESLPPKKPQVPMHNTPYHFYISNLMRSVRK